MIFLINKKLKRTVFIQNRDFELQYTLFKRLESKKKKKIFFFKRNFQKSLKKVRDFIQQECVKWIKLIVKIYIAS